MLEHEKINYVELPAQDIAAVKHFFERVFGWQFTDFGPDYCAFSDQGLDGGFYRSSFSSNAESGAALIVFYSESLEQTLAKIEAAGGRITKAIFDFPGGQRFHFTDPNQNEYAVWSSVE